MGSLKNWLRCGLFGAAGMLALLFWVQSERLRAARADATRWEAAAHTTTTVLRESQAGMDRLHKALAERRTALEAAEQERRALRQRLAALENDNATVRAWLDCPVPESVRGLLAD